MCEYCGCQSITAIDDLTREHEHVVNLIGDVRAAHRAADPAAMASAARRIAAVLGPHTYVEEHGLFPALAADFPDHVAALRDEHTRIDAVLAAAATGTPADPSWPDRLIAALHLLRAHILKEQDGVFPAALATLAPEQWAAVERARSRAGDHLAPAVPPSRSGVTGDGGEAGDVPAQPGQRPG